jgi:hypothetical protein
MLASARDDASGAAAGRSRHGSGRGNAYRRLRGNPPDNELGARGVASTLGSAACAAAESAQVRHSAGVTRHAASGPANGTARSAVLTPGSLAHHIRPPAGLRTLPALARSGSWRRRGHWLRGRVAQRRLPATSPYARPRRRNATDRDGSRRITSQRGEPVGNERKVWLQPHMRVPLAMCSVAGDPSPAAPPPPPSSPAAQSLARVPATGFVPVEGGRVWDGIHGPSAEPHAPRGQLDGRPTGGGTRFLFLWEVTFDDQEHRPGLRLEWPGAKHLLPGPRSGTRGPGERHPIRSPGRAPS